MKKLIRLLVTAAMIFVVFPLNTMADEKLEVIDNFSYNGANYSIVWNDSLDRSGVAARTTITEIVGLMVYFLGV